MNENEITSGMSASAVTSPASTSRTSTAGERSAEVTETASLKKSACSEVVVIVM